MYAMVVIVVFQSILIHMLACMGSWLRAWDVCQSHYNDVIMGVIASQITSLTTVYSIVYSDADQSKHQSSASLAFVRGIHRGPVNSWHKWPVTRKMFPFDDVIMKYHSRVRFWKKKIKSLFELSFLCNLFLSAQLAIQININSSDNGWCWTGTEV